MSGCGGVGVAGRLGATDLAGERVRPLGPREHAALVQGDGERERLRLPRLGEDRAVGVAGEAGQRVGAHPAGSR